MYLAPENGAPNWLRRLTWTRTVTQDANGVWQHGEWQGPIIRDIHGGVPQGQDPVTSADCDMVANGRSRPQYVNFLHLLGKAHDSRFKRDRQNARLTMHKPAPPAVGAGHFGPGEAVLEETRSGRGPGSNPHPRRRRIAAGNADHELGMFVAAEVADGERCGPVSPGQSRCSAPACRSVCPYVRDRGPRKRRFHYHRGLRRCISRPSHAACPPETRHADRRRGGSTTCYMCACRCGRAGAPWRCRRASPAPASDRPGWPGQATHQGRFAVAEASPSRHAPMPHAELKLDTPTGDVVKTTTCYMCACRCGIRVHLKDGRVRYIDGNPQHPVNRGVICAKVRPGSSSTTRRRACRSRCCGSASAAPASSRDRVGRGDADRDRLAAADPRTQSGRTRLLHRPRPVAGADRLVGAAVRHDQLRRPRRLLLGQHGRRRPLHARRQLLGIRRAGLGADEVPHALGRRRGPRLEPDQDRPRQAEGARGEDRHDQSGAQRLRRDRR